MKTTTTTTPSLLYATIIVSLALYCPRKLPVVASFSTTRAITTTSATTRTPKKHNTRTKVTHYYCDGGGERQRAAALFLAFREDENANAGENDDKDDDNDDEDEDEDARYRRMMLTPPSSLSFQDDLDDDNHHSLLPEAPLFLTASEEAIRRTELELLADLMDGDAAIHQLRLLWYGERGPDVEERLQRAWQGLGHADYWAGAEQTLRAVIDEQGPTYLFPFVLLSKLYVFQGKFEESQAICERIYAIKPYHFSIIENMVANCVALGQTKEAEYWQQKRLPTPDRKEERKAWVKHAIGEALRVLEEAKQQQQQSNIIPSSAAKMDNNRTGEEGIIIQDSEEDSLAADDDDEDRAQNPSWQ